METLTPKYLKNQALMKLRRGRDPKKLVLWYAGAVVGLSLAINLINLWLDHQMGSQGGLSNMGNVAIFATVQQSLPLVVSLVTMCLNLGYLSGMMRITRGQYADHTDLKAGFPLFWPMLRMTILLGFAYFAVIFLAFQADHGQQCPQLHGKKAAVGIWAVIMLHQRTGISVKINIGGKRTFDGKKQTGGFYPCRHADG